MSEVNNEKRFQPSQVYVREGVWQRTGLTYTEFMSMGIFERDEFIALINQRDMTCPKCEGRGTEVQEIGSMRHLATCRCCAGSKTVLTPWYKPWGVGINHTDSKRGDANG